MTKLSPFVPLLAPPVWTWTSGLFLTPLATALGSAHPDLVSSAVQCLVFTTSAILSGWVMGQAARGEVAPAEPHEMSTSEMLAALREGREQERAEAEDDRKYEASFRPGSLALGCANGERTQVFNFPAGITMEHLTAFGHCIASDKRPTFRNLSEAFDHTQWATFRNYLMVAEINKFGILAEYLDGREAWDVTALGRKMAIIWLFQTSPTGIPSSAIKCSLKGNKTTFEQSKQSKRS